MKKGSIRFYSLLVMCVLALMFGCSEERNAKVEVWLTDAPGDYEEVNINIVGVEVHANKSDEENGWKALDVNEGIYNLLDLTNGLDTLLGEIELPAGKISQIRLKLGEDNTVKVDGKLHDLHTPSAQQSGLKLQIHQQLEEGITYKILLDFDAARSVVQTGSGQYNLKPVIKTVIEAESGAIKGVVNPVNTNPAIYALRDADTVTSTFPGENGEFLLRGLPAGEYKVVFIPNDSLDIQERTNILVQTGHVTDMGTIEFDH